MRRWLWMAALLVSVAAWGQRMDTSTKIFHPSFRTLKIENSDDFYAPAIIRLGSDSRIIISFDEIGDDVSYLQYRLVHCNADWQPSRLFDSEILDGFNIGRIEDYAFSQNTFVHFVNYRLEIPNADMAPLASGNYLLQVFFEDEPDELVVQARFAVEEQQTLLKGNASARTDRGVNDDWQQLEFAVDLGKYQVRDPFTEIIVTVEQNGRTDNVRTLQRPTRISGNSLVYEHLPELIYPAGNEFIRFETTRVTMPGMHVDSIRFGGTNYHAWLHPDEPRVYAPYKYDETQFGRFKVKEYYSTDSDLGADYLTVNFALETSQLADRDVYVCGEFSQNGFSRANRMDYNTATRRYELTYPLKQGSYNYQYITMPKGQIAEGDASIVSGDKYETANEFVIKVFHREFGSRGDKLIGSGRIYTTR